jgi:ATP-binding cassette subfamily B protein
MVAAYYGRIYSLENLREKSLINREGTSMLGSSEAAENIGFRSTGVKVSFEELKTAPPALYCTLESGTFCSGV